MSPGIRVCIASSGLGHVARGIEAWAEDLGRALVERGEDVIVCKGAGEAVEPWERVVPCWTRESAEARRWTERIPQRFFWRFGITGGYGIEQTTFAWNLIKVLRKERIDVLHVQDPQVAVLVQHARRLGVVKTRTILAHGTEEPLEFLRRITYLQHLAPWHLEETVRGLGASGQEPVASGRWVAIPNFIDTERFRPSMCERERGREGEGVRRQTESACYLREELGIPDNAVVVLCAAAIKRHHKRVDYVLKEVAAMQARPMVAALRLPVYLVVAGGWEAETEEVMAEGQKLLGERVRFLVRFPRERMADLYRAADIFTLGSLKEMMPIALLEATASGLPCVVNKHPVMEWMIGPGGAAIDMSREGALAGELERLITERHRGRSLQEVGALAREHCVANFSKDRVVDQILEYYERIMADGGSRESGVGSHEAVASVECVPTGDRGNEGRTLTPALSQGARE